MSHSSGLLILINLAFVITFLTNFHTTNSDANPILSLSPVGLLNVALFTYPSNFQSVSSIPVSEFLYIISCNFSEASGQNCSIQYLGPFFDLY